MPAPESAASGSDPAQDRYHLADDGGGVAEDRRVERVVRDQPDVAVASLEGFDRGFAVGRGVALDHGGDGVAVLDVWFAAGHDPVAVARWRRGHGVPA